MQKQITSFNTQCPSDTTLQAKFQFIIAPCTSNYIIITIGYYSPIQTNILVRSSKLVSHLIHISIRPSILMRMYI